MNILFICSQGQSRSPTAEQAFASQPGCRTASAGIAINSERPLTSEAVEWAELIFVMEDVHYLILVQKFSSDLKDKRIITLNIRDEYEFNEPRLVRLLKRKVAKHLSLRRPPE